MNPAKQISDTTFNKYINRISSMCEWAQQQGYPTANPFKGKALKKTKRAHEERQEFSNADLNALFGTEIFTVGEFKHPNFIGCP